MYNRDMDTESHQICPAPLLSLNHLPWIPFLFFLLLSGCFTKTGPLVDQYQQTFSYQKIGFSLSMPGGWQVTSEPGVLFSSEFRRQDISLVRLALLTEETIPFLKHYLRISEKEKFSKRMLHFSKGQIGDINLRASKHYKSGNKTWIEIVWSGERGGISKIFHSYLIPTDNAIVQLHFEFPTRFYNSPDNMIKPVLKGVKINALPEPEPKELALIYRNIGTIYKNQGLFKEAIDLYRQALLKEPNDIELHILLGKTYFQKKVYTAALRTFLKATELSSQNAEAYKGLGETYLKMDRFDNGISAIKRALSLTDQEAPLYLLMGFAYLKQKKTEEAIQTFQRLLEERQFETEGHLGIGKAYLSMRLYEQAIFEFERVLERQPAHKEPHCLLEKAFFALGESKKAEEEKAVCNQGDAEIPRK